MTTITMDQLIQATADTLAAHVATGLPEPIDVQRGDFGGRLWVVLTVATLDDVLAWARLLDLSTPTTTPTDGVSYVVATTAGHRGKDQPVWLGWHQVDVMAPAQ